MKLSDESKNTLMQLQLLSGLQRSDINNVLNNFINLIVINYIEKKPTCIPYLGKFNFKYEGDNITSEGRKANISIEFEPDSYFLRVIGQIEDKEETEIEKHYLDKIKVNLEKIINNEVE